jgi:hypothetical protein
MSFNLKRISQILGEILLTVNTNRCLCVTSLWFTSEFYHKAKVYNYVVMQWPLAHNHHHGGCSESPLCWSKHKPGNTGRQSRILWREQSDALMQRCVCGLPMLGLDLATTRWAASWSANFESTPPPPSTGDCIPLGILEEHILCGSACFLCHVWEEVLLRLMEGPAGGHMLPRPAVWRPDLWGCPTQAWLWRGPWPCARAQRMSTKGERGCLEDARRNPFLATDRWSDQFSLARSARPRVRYNSLFVLTKKGNRSVSVSGLPRRLPFPFSNYFKIGSPPAVALPSQLRRVLGGI